MGNGIISDFGIPQSFAEKKLTADDFSQLSKCHNYLSGLKERINNWRAEGHSDNPDLDSFINQRRESILREQQEAADFKSTLK